MKRILKILKDKWYLLIIVAACIITQCYLQLMLPEYMGTIQQIMSQISDANRQESINNILQQGGWMLLISAAVVVLAIIQNFFGAWLGAFVGKSLRSDMFDKVNTFS